MLLLILLLRYDKDGEKSFFFRKIITGYRLHIARVYNLPIDRLN